MSLSFEEFLVALLFLVPGFLETSARRSFRPREFSGELERAVSSLVFSLILNAPAFILLLLSEDRTIGDFTAWLKSVGTPWLGLYLAGLYLAAIAVGTIRGLFPIVGLRGLCNRLGITRYSDASAVWQEVFAKHQPRNMKPWVWIRSKDAPAAFGRLRQSSAMVDRDKPIEVILNPFYREANGVLTQVRDAGGAETVCYRRLGPEDSVEFSFHPEEWKPA